MLVNLPLLVLFFVIWSTLFLWTFYNFYSFYYCVAGFLHIYNVDSIMDNWKINSLSTANPLPWGAVRMFRLWTFVKRMAEHFVSRQGIPRAGSKKFSCKIHWLRGAVAILRGFIEIMKSDRFAVFENTRRFRGWQKLKWAFIWVGDLTSVAHVISSYIWSPLTAGITVSYELSTLRRR